MSINNKQITDKQKKFIKNLLDILNQYDSDNKISLIMKEKNLDELSVYEASQTIESLLQVGNESLTIDQKDDIECKVIFYGLIYEFKLFLKKNNKKSIDELTKFDAYNVIEFLKHNIEMQMLY